MSIFNFILDLIYPPICITCEKILDTFSNNRFLCNKCMDSHSFLKIGGCNICGFETNNNLCDICSSIPNIKLTKNYSMFYYEGDYKSFIFKFKYGLNIEYSKVISKLMYSYILENNLFSNIDLITCVPMHKAKEKKRGFNQSELLAKDLSKYLNIPYKPTLIRTKNTVPQSSLNFENRFKNLNTVFLPIESLNLKNKNILIIDDIYTSGATIIECSKTLNLCGVHKIYALTFTIAKR